MPKSKFDKRVDYFAKRGSHATKAIMLLLDDILDLNDAEKFAAINAAAFTQETHMREQDLGTVVDELKQLHEDSIREFKEWEAGGGY